MLSGREEVSQVLRGTLHKSVWCTGQYSEAYSGCEKVSAVQERNQTHVSDPATNGEPDTAATGAERLKT